MMGPMRTAAALMLVGVALSTGGCLEREMTITSQPAGALVYVSDVEVGRTPVTIPFTWYGDYDVRLRLEGYETLATHAEIYPPIQEVPPFDLLCELAPWTIRDERFIHYELSRAVSPTDDELIERASRMREKNLQPAGD